MKKSAAEKEKEIAKMLYKQGFVLMTGAAESLLKEVFKSLLIEDFPRLQNATRTNFTGAEIQDIIRDAEETFMESPKHIAANFGRLMYQKLQDTSSPESKINFQNVQAMQGVFRAYFGIEFDNIELLNKVHRHWQIRHCIIHSDSRIDQNFINNVKKAEQLRVGDKLDKEIVINKNDYTEARNNYLDMFSILTVAISVNQLESRFVKIYDTEQK